MMNNPQSNQEDDNALAAEDLSQSYESLLRQQKAGNGTDDISGSERENELAGDETSSDHSPTATHHSPKRLVEALLFVGGNPLTAEGAAEVIRGLAPDQFSESVDSLNLDYRRQGRPYFIRLNDHGYVLELRPRYKPIWEKIYGTMREARLSTAAIDVLALVAYRQPVTKQEIESFRGAESGHLLRQLVRRRLVAVDSRAENGQRVVSYGTTERFLEMFGLKGLDDLPQTQDLQKL
jgi:segregation and condensation protein B